MDYISTGMGYHFSALLMSQMALHSQYGTKMPMSLVYAKFLSKE